jgi:Outer membrane protein beta-barrel domain
MTGKTKITIAIVALMVIAQVSHAAVKRGKLRKGFQIGLTGALNSAWIIKQTNYNTLFLFKNPTVRQSDMAYKVNVGGALAIQAGYNFDDHWGLIAEPGIVWSGQRYADNFVGPLIKGYNTQYGVLDSLESNPGRINVKRSVSLTFFQLPIYARYQCKLSDKVNFYAMLGPQLNFRMGASEVLKVNDREALDSLGLTASQKFASFDFGATLQAGVDVYLNDWMYIDAGINAYYGLLDINGSTLKDIGWYSKNISTYRSSKNMWGGIHVGIHIYLIKDAYY